MRFISWNVNGLRACLTKGFPEFFQQIDADIFCLQETKLQQGQVEMVLPGYRQYWNSAVKKGYSGTAVFSKKEPLSVSYGLGIEEHDQEGRVITLEFPAFYLTTVYTPNSQEGLKRLSYRMEWEDAFRDYLKSLLLAAGFIDSYRSLYPEKIEYSWWSYRFNARKNNAGWRIDYFLVSDRIGGRIQDAKIHTQVMGSDHCPVELDLDI